MISTKKLINLKLLISKQMKIRSLQPKVLDNVGDLFNELYYIYKDKYNEERHGLDTKNNKIFTTQN